jgi:nucleoredoxin
MSTVAAAAAAAAPAAEPQPVVVLTTTTNTTTTTPMEQLLGTELLTPRKNRSNKNSAQQTADLLRTKEFVLLYFSAHWCPPCQAFTPVLIEFYNKHIKNNKNSKNKDDFEIVYVSSDRTLQEFESYYYGDDKTNNNNNNNNSMPWLAIPTDAASAAMKQTLSTKLGGIRGIPTLIVLHVATGHFVTDDARGPIQQAVVGGNTKDAADAAIQAVVDQWRSIPTVTLEERAAVVGVFKMPTIRSLVVAVLKNPMYLFGMLYLFKKFMHFVNEWTKGGAVGTMDAEHEL